MGLLAEPLSSCNIWIIFFYGVTNKDDNLLNLFTRDQLLLKGNCISSFQVLVTENIYVFFKRMIERDSICNVYIIHYMENPENDIYHE